jgi:hypothetical protein
LLDLQEFIRSFKHDKNHDWSNDTADDFIEFQDTLLDEPKRSSGSSVVAPRMSGAVGAPFKLKRQYSDYRDINKRHFFPAWEKELNITALTHNCNNPLDAAYVPTTSEEIMAFAHNQAFMMGVFIQKIKYPSGKTIITRHLSDMDTQVAYAELKADATSKVVLQINKYKLEDALREMDAGPDKWNSGLEPFLDSFVFKLSQLNVTQEVKVPDQDSQEWLIHSLQNHKGAMAMVAHMQQLVLRDKQLNPTHKMALKDWIDGLTVLFQQWDKTDKLQTPCPKVKANKLQQERTGTDSRDKFKKTPMDESTKKKYAEWNLKISER